MKTAETILSEKGFFVMVHKDQSESVRKVFIDPVIEAMEEYAQERTKDMFEFIKWIGFYANKEKSNGRLFYREFSDTWFYSPSFIVEVKEYTLNELFQYWQNEIKGK